MELKRPWRNSWIGQTTMNNGDLYQAIKGPVAAGFIVREGIVRVAAPILSRAIMGKPLAPALHRLKRRGYTVRRVNT